MVLHAFHSLPSPISRLGRRHWQRTGRHRRSGRALRSSDRNGHQLSPAQPRNLPPESLIHPHSGVADGRRDRRSRRRRELRRSGNSGAGRALVRPHEVLLRGEAGSEEARGSNRRVVLQRSGGEPGVRLGVQEIP
ncbi:hypothetical protein LINPERHAP1_LOCUS18358 [Linum perenne]